MSIGLASLQERKLKEAAPVKKRGSAEFLIVTPGKANALSWLLGVCVCPRK
jgi:hypothetical protein